MARYVDEHGLERFWNNIKGRIGSASDEQVSDWLSLHPEATTTVQDGSVTDAKLMSTGGILEQVRILSDMNLSFEIGTIDSSGSDDDTSSNRIRSIDYIPVGNFYKASVDSPYRMRFFAYDASKTFVARTAWTSAGDSYTGAALRVAYPTAVYFRLIFAYDATSGGRTMTIDEVESSHIHIDFMSIKNEINSLQSKIDVAYGSVLAYEIGSISSAGSDDSATNRIRNIGFVDLSSFAYASIDAPYRFRWFAYDSGYSFLGRGSWTDGGVGFTVDDVITAFADARYMRLIFAYDASLSGRDMTAADIAASNIDVYFTKPCQSISHEIARVDEAYDHVSAKANEAYENVTISANQAAYMGDRVVIPVEIGASGGSQGGCVFGDEVFHFNTNGTFSVFSMATKQVVGSGILGSSATILPHCNSAVFGSEYYDITDDYPLLYVNAYNNTALPKGTCYVHRLQKDGESTWVTTLVQTITIGFTDNPVWTDGSSDTRPYGNFAVDVDGSKLWVYTLLDTTNVTRFFSFAMPELGSGDVTLGTSDIIDRFDVPRFAYIQDNHIAFGNMYICSGQANAGYIHVINLAGQKETTRIDLNKIGMTWEPEVIDIYDGHIICGKNKLYRFDL